MWTMIVRSSFSGMGLYADGHEFSAVRKIEIRVCRCQPAAVQLLRRGLFPCAPRVPSLAVDIRMLEFVNTLFTRMAPNSTAWCDALESFLDGRGYKLDTRVSNTFVQGRLCAEGSIRIPYADDLVTRLYGTGPW